MAVQPIPLVPADKAADVGDNVARPSRPRMSTRNRLLFFVTAWLVVLMPFMFWWSTWFGRALTAKQMGDYLNAKLKNGDDDGQQTRELRSPITGRVRTLSTATGANVVPGTAIATVEPGEEQVWEALRALYLIGQLEDLPAIRPYQRELPEVP